MIRFSRSEDYAVILVNELASHYNTQPVPLSQVAEKYKISLLFLRNLANTLVHAGIIKAIEGKNGGYFLTRSPKEMKIGEVLTVFTDKPMLECCGYGEHKSSCDKVDICKAGKVWRKLNQEFLMRVSDLTVEEFMHYETKK